MKNKIKKSLFTLVAMLPIPSLAYFAESQLQQMNWRDQYFPSLNGIEMEEQVSRVDLSNYLLGRVNPRAEYKVSYEDAWKNYLATQHGEMPMDEMEMDFDRIITDLIDNGIIIDRSQEGEIYMASADVTSIWNER
jgi:hypothetical protein